VPCGGAAGCVGGGGLYFNTEDSVSLDTLNADLSLDASNSLNSYIADDENVSQFFKTHIKSTYFDTDTFINKFKNSNIPLVLSIKIQSLNSKFIALKNFVLGLSNSNVPIDLIILQETWEIKYPSQLVIPGFQSLVFRNRGRGGGSDFM